MTAVIRTFPANETALARLTQRQRERNFAEEMEDRASMEAQAAFWTREVRAARVTLRYATHHTDDQLLDACAVLQSRWGDATDYLLADQMINAIRLRERHRAHEAAWQAVETPADVARRFAHRWPEIVSWGAFVAVALLWATGWLA